MPEQKPETLKKAEFIQYWGGLTPEQEIEMRPVPYKHEGSTYDQDSIRVTGTKDFVAQILARLQPLLSFEDANTRLQVTYRQIEDRETGRLTNSYAAYVQRHMRGPQARATNVFMEAATSESSEDAEDGEEPETNAARGDSNVAGDSERAIANQLRRFSNNA